MTSCTYCDGDGQTLHEELLPCVSGAPGGRWQVTWRTCEECNGAGWVPLAPLDNDEEE